MASARSPRLITPSGVVRLNHEAIPDPRDAMELQFEAVHAILLEGFNVGDKVEFTLDGKNWTLFAISKTLTAK